jgi:hypothetical protein
MHIAVARLTFSGEQSGSRRAVTNARAEALLDKQAIEYEREPSWIEKGQKPDFYCHGHPNFLVRSQNARTIAGLERTGSGPCGTKKQNIEHSSAGLWDCVHRLRV